MDTTDLTLDLGKETRSVEICVDFVLSGLCKALL